MTLPSSPRRGLELSSRKQTYTAFCVASVPERCPKEASLVSSRLSLTRTNTALDEDTNEALSALSCEAVRWLDTLEHTGSNPSSSVSRRRNLCSIPPEVMLLVLSFCDMRSLTHDLQLASRGLRLLARSGPWWDRFVLAELVECALPIVSRFVVIDNAQESMRNYRQRFWLRHLAAGRWPRMPRVLDLSKCESLPPLWTNRALVAASAGALRSVNLSHSNCTFLSSLESPEVMERGAPTILSVDFSFAVGLLNGQELNRFVTEYCPRIESLDISGCCNISDGDAAEMLRGVCHSLRVLMCRATALSFHWWGGEEMLPLLSKLVVSHSANVSDASLLSVARACPNIVVLQLASCVMITDGGIVQYLEAVEAIRVNVPLKELCLDDCVHVGDVGVACILTSCKELSKLSLDRLKFSGLFFTNGGVAASPCLATLSIVGCMTLLREVTRSVPLRCAMQKVAHVFSDRSRSFICSHKMSGLLNISGR